MAEKQSKVEQIDEQIKQLRKKRQNIISREKKEERKKRTHRLVQYGALAEKYFDFHGTPEEFEELLKAVVAGNDWRIYRLPGLGQSEEALF